MQPSAALTRLADLLDEELAAIGRGDVATIGRLCEETDRLFPIAARAGRDDRVLAGVVVERAERNRRAAVVRAGEIRTELQRLERGRSAIVAYGSHPSRSGTIMERAG